MIKKSWDEFRDLLSKSAFSGTTYVYMELSDEVGLYEYTPEIFDKKDLHKVLQVRVFNRDKEIRAIRPYISSEEIYVRVMDDTDGTVRDSFDQMLYLDMDNGSINEGNKRGKAINGGFYSLPFNAKAGLQLMVRNYLDYDDCGQARISDWRLCGFGMGGKSDD